MTADERARREPRDITERTFAFALRILKVVAALPPGTAGNTVGRQLARSGTSVGSNVEEAQGSHSKADFARRMNIARGEAREAHYWLRLAAESEMVPATRLEEVIAEADELVRILTTIVKKTKR